MAKKIQINETTLRKMIYERVINEIEYRKGVQFINEGMEMPDTIQRVWVRNGSNNESFLVSGTNHRYYNVYPNHHDSYEVESDSDLQAKALGEKIERAYRNKGIYCRTNVWNGELIVEFNRGRDDFDNEYVEPLIAWCERHGLKFKEKDDMYCWLIFTVTFDSPDISQERLRELLNGYTEITRQISPYLSGNSIDDGRNLGRYCQMAMNNEPTSIS